MKTIWKIILNGVVALAFIALTIFSLVEYRSDKVGTTYFEDRLSLIKESLTIFSKFFTYIENTPGLQFLLLTTKDVIPEKQLLNNIDTEQIGNLINKTNIKEKVTNIGLASSSTATPSINPSEIIKKLKEQLTKDWSRP